MFDWLSSSKDFHDNVDVLTLVIGIGGGAWALFQYMAAQRWKSSEFVASEITAFFDNPKVAAACKMMDWLSSTVVIRDLHEAGNWKSFPFNQELVLESLAAEKSGPSYGRILKFDRDEHQVRDIFDEFFTRLDRFNGYIDSRNRLFSPRKLKPYLVYYLEIINRDDTLGAHLRNFVDVYGYSGVSALVQAVLGKPWRAYQPPPISPNHRGTETVAT